MPGAIGARQSNLSNLFNQIKKSSLITEKNASVAINPNDDAHHSLAQKKSHNHGETSTKNHTGQHFPVAQQHYQISKSTSSSEAAQVASADVHNVDTQDTNTEFDRVRKSAEQFNGKCTWHFSQGSPEIKNIIGTEKKSANGICEMLAALWVEHRLHGSSLQSYLQDPTGKIDPDKIRQVQQLFILGVTMNPGAMVENKSSLGNMTYKAAFEKIQDDLIEGKFNNFFDPAQKFYIDYKGKKQGPKKPREKIINEMKVAESLSIRQKELLAEYLAPHNIKLVEPKQEEATSQWLEAKGIETTHLKENKLEKNMKPHDFYQQMAQAITKNVSFNQSDDCYQLITLKCPNPFGWAHRVSVLTDQNKIDFFDPNLGEFHFDDKKDFVAWWPTFLNLADYSAGKERRACDFYQATLCTPRQ